MYSVTNGGMRAAVLLVLYYIISCRVDRIIKNAPEPLGKIMFSNYMFQNYLFHKNYIFKIICLMYFMCFIPTALYIIHKYETDIINIIYLYNVAHGARKRYNKNRIYI